MRGAKVPAYLYPAPSLKLSVPYVFAWRRGELLQLFICFEIFIPKKMSTCFLESKDCSGCGHFSGVSAPISLLECQDDVSSHLKYYHLSSKILEYELILFRSGHFGLEMGKLKQMFVCSKHRNALGKHWKCGKSTCQHPEHKGKCEAVKGDRVFNARLARDVFEVYGIIVAVGSRE